MQARFITNKEEHDTKLPIIRKFLQKWYLVQVVDNGIEYKYPNTGEFMDNTRQSIAYWYEKTRPDLLIANHLYDFKISNLKQIDGNENIIEVNAMQFMLYWLHRQENDPFTYIVLDHGKEFVIFDLDDDVLEATTRICWVEFVQDIWFYQQYVNLIGDKIPVWAHRGTKKDLASKQDFILIDKNKLKRNKEMEKKLWEFYQAEISAGCSSA